MGLWSKIFGRQRPIMHTITAKNNPYKARIRWPPDFSQLTNKQQFRLEKKYRRRSKLKHMNEKWVKGVKIYQWVACTTLAVYALLFYDWPPEEGDNGEPAFWSLRQFVFGEYAALWTTAPEGWRPTPVSQATSTEALDTEET